MNAAPSARYFGPPDAVGARPPQTISSWPVHTASGSYRNPNGELEKVVQRFGAGSYAFVAEPERISRLPVQAATRSPAPGAVRGSRGQRLFEGLKAGTRGPPIEYISLP